MSKKKAKPAVSKKAAKPDVSERIGKPDRDTADGDELLTDAALLRLHSALGSLDEAIHDTRRALDQALGRTLTAERPRALPLKELNTLRDQLERAATPAAPTARASIMDIAADPAPVTDDEATDDGAGSVGVAPGGRRVQ